VPERASSTGRGRAVIAKRTAVDVFTGGVAGGLSIRHEADRREAPRFPGIFALPVPQDRFLSAGCRQAGGGDGDDLSQTASDPGRRGAQQFAQLSHFAGFQSRQPKPSLGQQEREMEKWARPTGVSRPQRK